MSFHDLSTAANFKDVVLRLIKGQIEKLRPAPRYARVIDINREDRVCIVVFNGDPDDAQVPVPMGVIQPSEVDQIVRIEGVRGDRFITDVKGPAVIDGTLL